MRHGDVIAMWRRNVPQKVAMPFPGFVGAPRGLQIVSRPWQSPAAQC